MLKTYLDSNEVDNPNGVKELIQQLFYDDDLKGVFYRIDGDLTFSGDGYDYIENIVFNQGICAQISFLMELSFVEYYRGIIHVPDVELNVSLGVVNAPVSDNNLSSYVYNNRNVKAHVNAAITKSGLAGFATSPRTGFQMFSPDSIPGVYIYTRDNVFTVDNCFAFLVDFMSDGQMTYSSPFFGSGGDGEYVCCASALHISNDVDVYPYMSFEELFTNLNKIFNLSIYIDYSGALPEMIIDRTDNLYTDTLLHTFENVTDLKASIENQFFFSSVEIGAEEVQEQGGVFKFPDGNFLGFKKEKFYISGQCNVDRTLNLVNDFIIDSNSIEDMLENQNDSFDEKVVLIQSDLPANNRATQNINIDGNGRVYNLLFNNYNKSLNYLGAIPNDLVLYISNAANNAQATKGAYSIPTGVIIHNTEVYDPANNYNPVTGIFTCPAGAEGSYSFTFTFTGLSYSGTLGTSAGSIKISHYSGGAVLKGEITLNTFTHTVVIIDFGGFTGAFSMDTGDYVEISGVAGLSSNTNFTSSTFTIDYIDIEGGIFQTYDPNDYKVMNLAFRVPLTFAEFETLKNNIIQRVKVESGKNRFYGWIKSIKRNLMTGMSDIILRTSNNSRQ